MNEDRFRAIICEEIDSRIANLEKTIGIMLANAIEPLVTKIDQFGERLDQSDESRASLLILTEKLVTSYERLVTENRELRESIKTMEHSMSDVMRRVAKLEKQPAA